MALATQQTSEQRLFRHTLHNMVNLAAPEQVYYALNSEHSPLHPPFIKFLAFSYADWLSSQQNVDQEKTQEDWRTAFSATPPKNGGYRNSFMDRDDAKNSDSDDSSDLGEIVTHPTAVLDIDADEDYDHDEYFMTAKGLRKKMKEKDPLKSVVPIFDTITFPSRQRGSGIDAADVVNAQESFAKLTQEKMSVIKSKLPMLADTRSPQEREVLICRKLKLCCVMFDFNSTNTAEIKAIEKKKTILTEILEYVARFNWYSEVVLKQCFETISCNLFRALPSPARPEDETEAFEDKSWQHLQLVYDLTLRLVICTDVDKKIMKKYLEGEFVGNIIELFASEDNREREYLKTILHRIYGRFMPLRGVIRTAISNCCFRTVYTPSRPENGIAEFLEIFCSIIHGFSIPVKEEHKEFLRNVLVPLHKCRKLEKFHEQLVACCVQFVFKDASVAPVILGGLLRFWPKQSPIKEEMFITELINIISALLNHKNGFEWDDYKIILMAVIDKIVECMTCGHHQVAERAVALWMEESMEMLADQDRPEIWTRLAAAFEKNKEHWNINLRQTNEEVLEHLRARDPDEWHVYEMKVLQRYRSEDMADESFDATIDPIIESVQEKAVRSMANRRDREDKWEKLLTMKTLIDQERAEVREEVYEPLSTTDAELVQMFQDSMQSSDSSSDDDFDDDSDALSDDEPRAPLPMNGHNGAEPIVYGNSLDLDTSKPAKSPPRLQIPLNDDDEDEKERSGDVGQVSPTKRRAAAGNGVLSPSNTKRSRSTSPSRRTKHDGGGPNDDESDHPRRISREDARSRSRSPQGTSEEKTEGSPKRSGRTRTNQRKTHGRNASGPPRSPNSGRPARSGVKSHAPRRQGDDRPNQNKSRPSRPVQKRGGRSRKGNSNYAE